jgi:DNA-binding transcriptional LysR family regulator
LTGNHAAALQIAVHKGVGLAMMPSFVAARDLESGAIEAVLADWRLPDLHVFAVYPHRRFLSPKVRVVVDALRAAFGDGSHDPWWTSADTARGTGKLRSHTSEVVVSSPP